jgi:hypothetical protein
MNFLRLPAVLVMSEKAFRVGPGSVNDQPPTEIQVCMPLYLSFKAVNRRNSDPELSSMGLIRKLVGSKNANAKLTCVNPCRSSCSGETLSSVSHWSISRRNATRNSHSDICGCSPKTHSSQSCVCQHLNRRSLDDSPHHIHHSHLDSLSCRSHRFLRRTWE